MHSKHITQRIIFGSMRMSDYNYSIKYWTKLLKNLYEKDIKVHHISNEYNSFQLYLEVYKNYLKHYPNDKISHIVKLAEPHFSNTTFSKTRLFEKVNFYLKSLNTKKIFGVQWMWRSTLKESLIISDFKNKSSLIYDSFNQLKHENKIQNFFVFPYFSEFADTTNEIDKYYLNFYDGLIVYRNFNEIKFDALLRKNQKENYIIRPLDGGKLIPSITPNQALNFSLNIDNVYGAIVSISSYNKFIELIK